MPIGRGKVLHALLWLIYPISIVKSFPNSPNQLTPSLQGGKLLKPAHNPQTAEKILPPWLLRYENVNKKIVKQKIEWLEFTLFKQGFSPLDIRDISITIEYSVDKNYATLAGTLDLLKLIITLEDKPLGKSSFLSKEVILSSILHYAACIRALKTGVYDAVSSAIYHERSTNTLLPTTNRRKASVQGDAVNSVEFDNSDLSGIFDNRSTSESRKTSFPAEDKLLEKPAAPSLDKKVSKITSGAAKIKRAEVVANVVLGIKEKWTKEEARKFRGLLLSITDDWRSLGIRVFACLYRLEGALDFAEMGTNQYFRSPEIVRNAREALRIYAPLAEQLGMQLLKKEIQDKAFQILYRRQYRAASALYQRTGPAMKAMSRYLEAELSRLLFRDEKLINELENLQITSRVKEPYSSWKKLVKKRLETTSNVKLLGMPCLSTRVRDGSSSEKALPELSLMNLNDSVALRIILQARKHTADETDEATRTREQLLCYYVQHLIRTEWPTEGPGILKDYIRYPKPNGYQSLHYTSVLSSSGKQWPFEIQIRSGEMHRIAEYGFAAHWDYKLGEQTKLALLPRKVDGKLHPVRKKDTTSTPLLVASPSENSYIDALANAKQQLVQNKVFLFFVETDSARNERRIISLPLGARVRDALECLETIIGDYIVLKNGIRVDLETMVENGDVIFIKKG